MLIRNLPWEHVLQVVDRTMKAISGVTDPEQLVEVYWKNIGELVTVDDYVSVSRRNVEPPYFLITRSSRFREHFNPWTQRDRLPRMSGGILGEIAYANRPVIIDDLPSRLSKDDPAYFYLEGFQSLAALPNYDSGEGLNVTVMLLPPGKELDHEMIPMLHWQAGLFGRGTQNLVLRNQLAGALESLDRELQTVGQIQKSLLPAELPQIAGFEVAAFYQTSARAGGDYYDFFPLDGNGFGMFIADVSGHGTPAAVLMAITHAIAHGEPGTHTPPSALLGHLNNSLARAYTRDGTFVTAFYAVLDPVTRQLCYSTAGHNPPRLLRGGKVIVLDKSGGLPMGIIDGEDYSQSSIGIEPGDLLVLYTDGITEARSPRTASEPGELFGTDRMDHAIRNVFAFTATTAQACIDRIRADVAIFTANAPPTDDQTLIVLRCLDHPSDDRGGAI
jgi:sigma-B regulation protein RsbU (phosphoserine phosphatase)